MIENKNELFSNPDAFHAHLAEVQKTEAPHTETKSDDIKVVEEKIITETPIEAPEQEATTDSAAEDLVAPEVNETASETTTETAPKNWKEEKFIPKSRLNEELQKRHALEEEVRKEREGRIRLETQMQMIANAQESMKQTNEPNIEDDILDTTAHKIYMKKINELESKIENMNTNTESQFKQNSYFNIVSSQEQAFEKEHPDFKDALSYLTNVETNVAKELYDGNVAETKVREKMQEMVVNSIAKGKNAANTMYELAKTYGYTPKAEAKKTTGANLSTIESNMKKTASIHSLPNNAASGGSSSIQDISPFLNNPKNPYSGIDPDKFQAHLKHMESRGIR